MLKRAFTSTPAQLATRSGTPAGCDGDGHARITPKIDQCLRGWRQRNSIHASQSFRFSDAARLASFMSASEPPAEGLENSQGIRKEVDALGDRVKAMSSNIEELLKEVRLLRSEVHQRTC